MVGKLTRSLSGAYVSVHECNTYYMYNIMYVLYMIVHVHVHVLVALECFNPLMDALNSGRISESRPEFRTVDTTSVCDDRYHACTFASDKLCALFTPH